MSDLTQAQYLVKGPYKHGDGSYTFKAVLFTPGINGVGQIEAIADVQVNSDQACAALARALAQIAQQLPPELALGGN